MNEGKIKRELRAINRKRNKKINGQKMFLGGLVSFLLGVALGFLIF